MNFRPRPWIAGFLFIVTITSFSASYAYQCRELFYPWIDRVSEKGVESAKRLQRIASFGERYRRWVKQGYDPVQCPMPEKFDDMVTIRNKLLELKSSIPSVESDDLGPHTSRYRELRLQGSYYLSEILTTLDKMLMLNPPNLTYGRVSYIEYVSSFVFTVLQQSRHDLMSEIVQESNLLVPAMTVEGFEKFSGRLTHPTVAFFTILDGSLNHLPTYKEHVAAIAESVFIGTLSLHNNNLIGNQRTVTSRSLYVNSLGNFLAWQRSEFAGLELVDLSLIKFLTFTIQSIELSDPRLSKIFVLHAFLFIL